MESSASEGRETRLFESKAEKRMEMVHLPLAEIEVRHNPRRLADVAGIRRLATSIARVGLEQPLLVSREGEGYVLVAGGRRLAAVKELGWGEAPCVVMRDDDPQLRRIRAGAENLGRLEMSAADEAVELAAYMKELGLTLEEAAEAVGITPETARTRRLPLLSLPESVRSKLHSGAVGVESAMKLVKVAERSPGLSEDLAERLATGALERRAFEADPAAALSVVSAEEGESDALCLPFSEGTRLEVSETARRVLEATGEDSVEEEVHEALVKLKGATGKLLEVTVTDITAAQGSGALVSYRRGPSTVDFLVYGLWAAEWLAKEGERAKLLEEEEAESKDEVTESTDAEAERLRRREAMLDAQHSNAEIGNALQIEFDHLREVPMSVAEVIAGHLIDAYGTQMALGARLVRRKWWRRQVKEMRSGGVSSIERPLEADEARRRLEEHVLAGESGAEVIGRLAAHLIAAVSCDQDAVAPSQRRRILLPYGGEGTVAGRMGSAIGELCGKVLPKKRYERLSEELGLSETVELPDRRSPRQIAREEREAAARESAKVEEERRERLYGGSWGSLLDDEPAGDVCGSEDAELEAAGAGETEEEALA